MNDVIEVSYTGDLLAHRRCPRAWAYEKHAGSTPTRGPGHGGRLVHHAMEWLTTHTRSTTARSTPPEINLAQLNSSYFRILWGKGIRTTFSSRDETIERVANHLYPLPKGQPLPEVKAVVEGALHEEYPLRSVRKVVPARFGGKSRVLLTGVLDVVVQQQSTLTYQRVWQWTDTEKLDGEPVEAVEVAQKGDLEIWDYKGTRSSTGYLEDYVRQVVTYAALLEDRLGLPKRCVLFFVNEPDRREASPGHSHQPRGGRGRRRVDPRTSAGSSPDRPAHARRPLSIEGGDLRLRDLPLKERVTTELKAQCTACGQRFDLHDVRLSPC